MGEERQSGADWLLTRHERGNPDTALDARHPDGAAFTTGNDVRALVHGAVYFTELLANVAAMEKGDLLLFTDWRGDPDERLDGPGSEISRVLCEAARRGVVVKGLVWRSHWDRLQFSAAENDHLGEEIEAAGGEVLRDMRVRPGGSHHQKMVVLRHPGRPEQDVAYVGGIDLCHSRRDDVAHRGDPQPLGIADEYGPKPPWHDVQLAIRGPAVGDVEATFRERWCDPSPLTRSPVHRFADLVRREDTHADPIPEQLADPAPQGGLSVQVLRTYPFRRKGFPFARLGERSIARAYRHALELARELIYVEDQYLWSTEIAEVFAEALAQRPALHLVGVVPMHPDTDGISGAAQSLGRKRAMARIAAVAPDRFAIYAIENPAGTPIYVHAKVCVVDDAWTSVGSDNVNLRSWTHDSELSCAVVEPDGSPGFGRELRLRLAREHLVRPEGADRDLVDAKEFFAAYAAAARELDSWYAAGQQGPRPAGRLRRYVPPHLSRVTTALAGPLYRFIADPDGRPRRLRREGSF